MTTQTQTRELCQRALDSAMGIEILFRAADFEFDWTEARHEAQTLQRRIRAFRIKAKGFENVEPVLVKQDEGFAVRILPHALSNPVKGEVRDLASGSVLTEFNETSSEVNAITYHLLRSLAKSEPPITLEQEKLLWTHSPDAARDLYNAAGWSIRGEAMEIAK